MDISNSPEAADKDEEDALAQKDTANDRANAEGRRVYF
jgi:hypothetical protein